MESIYSAIYSDKSDDDKASSESSDFEFDTKNKKASPKKLPTKKSSSRRISVSGSAASSSATSSESASSEEEEEEAIISSSEQESSSEFSSPSESSSMSEPSPSEVSEDETPKVTKKAKSKAVVKSSASEEEKQDSDVDVEKTKSSSESGSESEKAEETEKSRKPVPIRRPSALQVQDTESPTSKEGTPEVSVKVPEESPTHIIDHCYARPSSEQFEETENKRSFERQLANDHGYTRPRSPPKETVVKTESPAALTPQNRNKIGRKPSVSLIKPSFKPSKPAIKEETKVFKPREHKEQFDILYKFLKDGIDLEDMRYLKRSYEMMLNDLDRQKKDNLLWLNDTHWVDHPVTDIPDPPRKRRRDDFSRPHTTGCCRTEGYYKMDPREKARTKYHLHRSLGELFNQTKIGNIDGSATKGKIQTAQSLSREARSVQRRQLAVLGDEVSNSDLLKFNQLKVI